MTTRAALIEIAARAACVNGEECRVLCWPCRMAGRRMLDAIVPAGEAWIAPWEATDAMRTAWHDVDEFASFQKEWAAVRDAHLSDSGK